MRRANLHLGISRKLEYSTNLETANRLKHLKQILRPLQVVRKRYYKELTETRMLRKKDPSITFGNVKEAFKNKMQELEQELYTNSRISGSNITGSYFS